MLATLLLSLFHVHISFPSRKEEEEEKEEEEKEEEEKKKKKSWIT